MRENQGQTKEVLRLLIQMDINYCLESEGQRAGEEECPSSQKSDMEAVGSTLRTEGRGGAGPAQSRALWYELDGDGQLSAPPGLSSKA